MVYPRVAPHGGTARGDYGVRLERLPRGERRVQGVGRRQSRVAAFGRLGGQGIVALRVRGRDDAARSTHEPDARRPFARRAHHRARPRTACRERAQSEAGDLDGRGDSCDRSRSREDGSCDGTPRPRRLQSERPCPSLCLRDRRRRGRGRVRRKRHADPLRECRRSGRRR